MMKSICTTVTFLYFLKFDKNSLLNDKKTQKHWSKDLVQKKRSFGFWVTQLLFI